MDGVLDLDRLIVDPRRHHLGIGARLVRRAPDLADRIAVSTGRANVPARALYESQGFRHLRDREVVQGLWVSDYGFTRPPA